jgi:glycerate kinase
MTLHSILIAPYAFKGTLTAAEAADAIASAIPSSPGCRLLPLGDGGAGTLNALVRGIGGEMRLHRCTRAVGDPAECPWGILDDGRAVIEAAGCIALADVPPDERDPSRLTTRGLGELVIEAMAHGCSTIVLGLGDTATHDCALGMASALGYRFLDDRGDPLEPIGASLPNLARIISDDVLPQLRSTSFTLLCDVLNPLLGPDGAALRFASQKGADEATVQMLEAGSRRFATIVERDLGRPVADIPGAGAAGGLGAGAAAFLLATLASGADAVLDAVGFDRLLPEYDLVVTGEGRIDRKTLLGKGTANVARRAARAGVGCVIVTGMVEGDRREFERELGATIIECGGAGSGEPSREDAHRNLRDAVRRYLQSGNGRGTI